MTKPELVGEVVGLIVELQDATQSVDEAAADHLGVNLTDLRCLRVIGQDGPTTAGDLAQATGLTRAAITFAIDRLEQAGLAARTTDPADRRRTLVEPTAIAQRSMSSLWGPLHAEGSRTLSRYTTSELRVLIDFLRKSIDLQQDQALRIKTTPDDESVG